MGGGRRVLGGVRNEWRVGWIKGTSKKRFKFFRGSPQDFREPKNRSGSREDFREPWRHTGAYVSGTLASSATQHDSKSPNFRES